MLNLTAEIGEIANFLDTALTRHILLVYNVTIYMEH
jgi:hypothetical protein